MKSIKPLITVLLLYSKVVDWLKSIPSFTLPCVIDHQKVVNSHVWFGTETLHVMVSIFFFSLCAYVSHYVYLIGRSQWSGKPQRFLVSSCLVWGSQSGHRLHHHQQIPRKTLRLPTGAFLWHLRLCFSMSVRTPYDRSTHTYAILALLPYLGFSFASVNTIKPQQWLTGNCPSEAYNPLVVPADWIAIPDDLILKR